MNKVNIYLHYTFIVQLT